LPIGVGASTGHTDAVPLAVGSGAALLVAGLARRHRSAVTRALAAGALYGIADAGIKAATLATHRTGPTLMLVTWVALAAAATLGGFLAFQAALRDGDPVGAISLMTAVTALVALLFGVTAFGESLGTGAGATLLHLLAIALVLACVPVLAAAEQALASADAPPGGRGDRWGGPPSDLVRALRRGALRVAAMALVPVTLVSGFGLLYGLRGLGWAAGGPAVSDALPLLQLAGYDAQPLARVVVAWLAAGVVCGVALRRVRPLRRAVLLGAPALLLLLFASEIAFALARNLRLSDVLTGRLPGPGPWIEALVFAAGAAVPQAVPARLSDRVGRLFAARPLVSSPPSRP
jgi:hypothetical protein